MWRAAKRQGVSFLALLPRGSFELRLESDQFGQRFLECIKPFLPDCLRPSHFDIQDRGTMDVD
jgi:hypothetical protein